MQFKMPNIFYLRLKSAKLRRVREKTIIFIEPYITYGEMKICSFAEEIFQFRTF